MKYGFLAKKAGQMILIKFKNYFQKSCKTKEKKFPQIKSNQAIICHYQEEYKRFNVQRVKLLEGLVCFYREKHVKFKRV